MPVVPTTPEQDKAFAEYQRQRAVLSTQFLTTMIGSDLYSRLDRGDKARYAVAQADALLSELSKGST